MLSVQRELRRQRTSVARWSAMAAVLFLAGCGGSDLNLAPVEGIVTLDGKPIPDAAVLFLPDDPTMGPPAAGTTDGEGRFTLITANLPGAAVGSHRVAISKDQTQVIPTRKGFPIYKTTYTIPPKYAAAESSGLVATVADDVNTIDFKLSTR
jgi:hypothetical protein